MPKIIELTVEIDVQNVSCPGVWLCQDGRVRLLVYALGTAYQTCLLPPIFPLQFRDIFYFKKRFRETCAINNICCLLKDETIYCELIQYNEDCMSEETIVLAQYLGSLNDVLFPPNNCSNDGVDLLTRRTRAFPGILSPKIEVATKVRIDEIWDQNPRGLSTPALKKPSPCSCTYDDPAEPPRTPRYYRCNAKKSGADCRARSRSRSAGCRTYQIPKHSCVTTNSVPVSRCRPRLYHGRTRASSHSPRRRDYCVYNVTTSSQYASPRANYEREHSDDEYLRYNNMDSSDSIRHPDMSNMDDEQARRIILESNYINNEKSNKSLNESCSKIYNVNPCVCEICKKYHELFHKDKSCDINDNL